MKVFVSLSSYSRSISFVPRYIWLLVFFCSLGVIKVEDRKKCYNKNIVQIIYLSEKCSPFWAKPAYPFIVTHRVLNTNPWLK